MKLRDLEETEVRIWERDLKFVLVTSKLDVGEKQPPLM